MVQGGLEEGDRVARLEGILGIFWGKEVGILEVDPGIEVGEVVF